MLTVPQLPLPIRAVNATVGLLDRVGLHPASLTANKLLATAQNNTGLSDFGDDSYREGFERLLWSLQHEANLSALGRLIAREEILTALSNKLQIVDHHKRYPEIAQGKIEKPIIIIGMGRSGTTIMHELMALDDTLRSPQTWEVDHPFPAPETASYKTDARIAETQKTLERTDFILPDFKKIHRMGATLPQECVRWTTGDFKSMIYWTSFDVPSYSEWLMKEADISSAYRYHKQFLQLLQWKHPGAPWVLKSPGHLWTLDALLQEYPDARFIQTHRDPLKILTSLSSLVTALRKMSSNRIDPYQISREWAVWNAQGLNASVEFRKKGLVPAENFVDISFYEFMQSPIEQIKIIYQQFGLSLSSATEQKMSDYLHLHSQEQHGRHDYKFSDTGLDLQQERQRVQTYQDYFNTTLEIN